jgi:hypothetical protein
MTFDDWKQWQALEIEKQQKFRRRQLALMNPLATFRTLDNEFWNWEMVEREMALEFLAGMESNFLVSCGTRKPYAINKTSVYVLSDGISANQGDTFSVNVSP